MKDYLVKALINFNDVLENKKREEGDTFECTKERYEVLSGKNEKKLVAVELISKPEPIKEEVKPKKKTAKKK